MISLCKYTQPLMTKSEMEENFFSLHKIIGRIIQYKGSFCGKALHKSDTTPDPSNGFPKMTWSLVECHSVSCENKSLCRHKDLLYFSKA